jgi:peptidoglycan/xylan/chitin deacetylase (PgdA/CDA1 family)
MKRLIILAISLVVRCVDFGVRTASRLLGRTPPPCCAVLYYHEIEPDQRGKFARQMDEIVRLTQVIRADQRWRLEPGRYYSAITFDDGFVSVLENALPEMEARGIPATLFIPTGYLGKRPEWIRDPAFPGYHQKVMSADQLAGFKDHPLFSLESHSCSHPDFLKLDEDQARSEFRESKTHLERILGKKVTQFSFPYGAHDSRLVELALEAGYERVFTVEPRAAFADADEAATGRVAANPGDWPIEFRLKLLGAYRWRAHGPRLRVKGPPQVEITGKA